ncbi:hypothetical protein ACVBEH_06170 [Roseateles sp. GG27B]
MREPNSATPPVSNRASVDRPRPGQRGKLLLGHVALLAHSLRARVRKIFMLYLVYNFSQKLMRSGKMLIFADFLKI